MENNMDDDTPFNPFYIGPNPSKACANEEVPPRECSPDCIPAADNKTADPNPPTSSTAQGNETSSSPCKPYNCNYHSN
ncbi:uncharacterized protein LOC6564939 [Drosophila grimshawi]|uniref:GH12510 n=1 Tax=Drosophila grimshawi TaxID=7222 RepID=B4JJL9_DROGR|nr:uncharacterized protein LOC6564939 [Drosophila grimshawi]EDV99771.1 GH12510 [Drosophila grimshawi]